DRRPGLQPPSEPLHDRRRLPAARRAGGPEALLKARGALGLAELELPTLGVDDEHLVEAFLASGWLQAGAGDVDRDVGDPRLAFARPVPGQALLRGRVEEIDDGPRARGVGRRDERRAVGRPDVRV